MTCKTKVICILSLTFAISKIYGQNYSCDGFDANTFTHTTDIWDWRNSDEENWAAYVISEDNPSEFVETTLRSPFFDYGIFEPNVSHLYNNSLPDEIDYQPTDGWELLYKNFGGNSQNTAVDNPLFTLYNRFSGQIRVFLYARKSIGQIVSDANLSVGFDGSQGIASSLLAYVEANSQALNKSTVNHITNSNHPNEYNNPIDGTWLFCQLPTFYDPCACIVSEIPKIKIEAAFIEDSQIDINGITGAVPPYNQNIASGTDLNSNLSNSLMVFFNTLSNGFEEANSTYKSLNSFTTSYQKFINNRLSNADEPKDQKFELPNFLKALPVVGKYVSLVSFFVNSPTSKNSTKKISPNANFQESKIKGSLNTTGEIQGHSFYIPGTDHSSLPGINNKPVYKYTLGNVSLLEEPIIEYATYKTDDEIEYFNAAEGSGSGRIEEFYDPNIQQYHLKNSLKLLVNPASELTLVEIKGALIYGFNKSEFSFPLQQMKYHVNVDGMDITNYPIAMLGPVGGISLMTKDDYISSSFEERLDHVGIIVENRPKTSLSGSFEQDALNVVYSSGLKNLECLQQESVFIASSTRLQSYNKPDIKPWFKIRLVLTLKRNDAAATSESDYIRMVTTFDAKVEDNIAQYTNPENSNSEPMIGSYNFYKNYNMYDLANDGYWPHYLWHFFPYNFQNPQGTGSFFPTAGYQVPLSRTFRNVSLTTPATYEAKKTLRFVNVSSTTAYNSSKYTAGYEIDIENESEFLPGVEFEIAPPSAFDECKGQPTFPFMFSSSEHLDVWCANNYSNEQMAKKGTFENNNPNLSQSKEVVSYLYPNPCMDFVNMDLRSSNFGGLSFTIYDVVGKPMLNTKISTQKTQINLTSLPAGMYIMKIFNDGIMIDNHKFVKVK